MARKPKEKKDKDAPVESKANRFVRVVRPRVNKAVKAISVIGYCAGAGYEYTPDQVRQIIITLSKAVGEVESRFAAKQKKQDEFNFA